MMEQTRYAKKQTFKVTSFILVLVGLLTLILWPSSTMAVSQSARQRLEEAWKYAGELPFTRPPGWPMWAAAARQTVFAWRG